MAVIATISSSPSTTSRTDAVLGDLAQRVQRAGHVVHPIVLRDLPADGTVRVLVAHGGVDVLDPDPGKPSLIRLESLHDALDRGAVHYVALGDKHSLAKVGATGRVWYSGSPEVTNYDDVEADPGHVLVVDVEHDTVAVESHQVGHWQFITLRHDVDDSRDIAGLDINLDQLPDKDRTAVRLVLNGTLTVTDKARLDACLDRYARLFASLRLWERHTDIAVMPADGEFDDLAVGGFARGAVQELMATARADGADADDARSALALLLRLSEGSVA